MYKKKLLELGIPASIRGFEYLNYAIGAYKPMQSIMSLYQDVAEKFGTSPSKAERNMRHAISKINENIHVGEFVAEFKVRWGLES